jgi:hypothetical protein
VRRVRVGCSGGDGQNVYQCELEIMWLSIKVLDGGLFKRFDVLKRLVVAEIDLIEDNAMERVALPTGVWLHLCPMTEWNILRGAS